MSIVNNRQWKADLLDEQSCNYFSEFFNNFCMDGFSAVRYTEKVNYQKTCLEYHGYFMLRLITPKYVFKIF